MKLQRMFAAVLMLAVVVAMAAPVLAEEATITGIVEIVGDSLVITAEDGQYKIGGLDLAKMVGQKVRATGMVTETDGAKNIEVTAVKAAQEPHCGVSDFDAWEERRSPIPFLPTIIGSNQFESTDKNPISASSHRHFKTSGYAISAGYGINGAF